MPTLEQLRACRAFLIDMDGTLYISESLIPGAREFLELLAERAVPHVFLTNNSSRSGSYYQQRLARMGIEVGRDRILTSGDATIAHILETTPYRSAYVVGTPELCADFEAAGVTLDEVDPDCVVVAFDTTLTFAKLESACRLLFAGKPYFATHPDKTCITDHGLIPDIAAIIAACEAVTGRTPHIIGKPRPEMVAAALRRLGSTAAETSIVGDQLDTDLTMAQDAGLVGVLVRTGETTPAKLEAWPADRRDFLIADSVAQVVSWLRDA